VSPADALQNRPLPKNLIGWIVIGQLTTELLETRRVARPRQKA
jgi:hypothetical protein